jgi:hypothetical protein
MKTLKKSYSLLLLFMLISIEIYSQKHIIIDTLPFYKSEYNVIPIGIVRLDSLIVVSLDRKSNESYRKYRKNNHLEKNEVRFIYTEKKYLDTLLTVKATDSKYIIFADYCYEIVFNAQRFVYQYVLPYMPDNYKDSLKGTYINAFSSVGTNIIP